MKRLSPKAAALSCLVILLCSTEVRPHGLKECRNEQKKFSTKFIPDKSGHLAQGFSSQADTLPVDEITDSLITPLEAVISPCGISPAYLKSLVQDTNVRGGRTPVGNFPASAIEHCGKFDIYYEDLIPNVVGFADATHGQDRRTTLCAVLTYVQSVFDFSAIPANAPIRLHVSQSIIAAPPGTMFLAQAGPYHNTTPNTITYGFVRDYTISGNDPAVGQYHAELLVNFDKTYDALNVAYPISWHNTTGLFTANCNYDLYSVLLHEIGHTLGWISYIHRDNNLLPESIHSNNQFSGLDAFLQKGTVFPSASLIPLLTGLNTSTPTINPLIAASNTAITNRDIWVTPNAAPDNHPVYSGVHFTAYPLAEGSLLSHLDDQAWTYSTRSRISPGDIENYVMGLYAAKGLYKRILQDIEINTLGRLGYSINPSVATSVKYINRTPYSKRMAAYTNIEAPSFSETVFADYNVPNSGSPVVVIDLSAIQSVGADIIDPDGDPISVEPNSLLNIRGGGNGGNNQSQLVLSNNNRTITFTPRQNFYGRAQFGFRLFDGHEAGSYVVYTIDVLKGTNVNCAPGTNIVLNGNLEEGSELKRLGIEESIDGGQQGQYMLREGHLSTGIHFGDCHPYNWTANEQGPYGSGDLVKNSFIYCNGTTFKGYSGHPSTLAGGYGVPILSSTGDRYRRFNGNHLYFNLCSDMQTCKKYVLKFEYYARPGATNGTIVPITFGFTNQATHPSLPNLAYSNVHNLVVTNGSWQQVSIPFVYCGNPASILNLRQTTIPSGDFFIDNISLEEDTNPLPPLTVSVSPSNPTVSSSSPSVTLTANVSNPLCNTTYLWQPGGFVTSTITVSPTATTNYTVTVNDNCRSTTNTITVNFLPDVCKCDPNTYSNLNYRPSQGGFTRFITCGDTLDASCISGGFNWTLKGNFQCTGDSCSSSPLVTAVLTGPTGTFAQNSPVVASSFDVAFPATHFATTGMYDLTLKALCGEDTCTCSFKINAVGCPQDSSCVINSCMSTWQNLLPSTFIQDMIVFQNKLIVAGSFSLAGTQNIAAWDGSTWSALGNGINGSVWALAVYNGELYAGGAFTSPGSNIAKWDGNTWTNAGSGTNRVVLELLATSNGVIAGGTFSSPFANIAQWDGNNWLNLGTGTNGSVFGLGLYNNDLIAGGVFTTAGGSSVSNIAKWDGSNWSAFGNGGINLFPTNKGLGVSSILQFNNDLIVGGRFQDAVNSSPVPNTQFIARWDGSNWNSMATGVNTSFEGIYDLKIYGGELYAGGFFTQIGGSNISGVARWNGTNWISTGHSNRLVRALESFMVSNKTCDLYSGGEVFLNRLACATSSTNVKNKLDIKIYPNPTLNTFTLEMPETNPAGMSFRISDLLGRRVMDQASTTSSRYQLIDASLLVSGFYLVQVLVEGKVVAVEKLLKQ